MVFTKTIIHKYSDIYPFDFNDFVFGTLSLLQYGIDNRMNVKINLADSYLSQYVTVTNTDTNGFPTMDYSNKSDLALLYSNLEDFKTNTAGFLVVTTNWRLHSSRVSEFAVIEFKNMVLFNQFLYTEALHRVTTELLNIHLPHTVPIITTLIPQNHVCVRDPRIHEHPKAPVTLPTDYNMIYVDINENVCLNHLDTVKLADTIRKSLILDKNILLISNNKILGNCLTELLEVNYVPNLVVDIDDASGSLESLSWEPVDELVHCIMIANTKKLFVFSEQSRPLNEAYLAAKQISRVSIQTFKFFYSKVEISPMPIYR